jgi:type IV pilus assembly protein PilO
MIESFIHVLREQFWRIIAGIAGLLFIMIFVSHLLPFGGEIGKINRTIQQNNNRIHQAENWKGTFRQLNAQKKHLEKRVEQFVSSQKQDTQLSSMIAFLSESAKQSGVLISAIQPREIEKKKQHTELPVELTLLTTYHKLGKFINIIETSEQVIKIRYLKIVSRNLSSNQLQVEIVLHYYYLEYSV